LRKKASKDSGELIGPWENGFKSRKRPIFRQGVPSELKNTDWLGNGPHKNKHLTPFCELNPAERKAWENPKKGTVTFFVYLWKKGTVPL
jgi:hypothetical protein